MHTRDLKLTGSFLGLLALAFTSGCGGGATPGGPGATDAQGQTMDPVTGLPVCATDPAKQTADRCVDPSGAVMCKVNSGFPGDELAICAPDPAKGLLLHYGPGNYDDPAELDAFTIPAGGEDETCTFVHSTNDTLEYVKNYHGRLRPHSHHLIVTTLAQDVPDDDRPVKCSPTDAVGSRWLVGSQSPKMDVAVGGADGTGPMVPQPGDPDYHLAQKVDARTPMRLDLHYVNSTEEPLLKEAWVAFDYTKEEDVANKVDMITFFQGDIDVPPHQSQDTKLAKCTAPSDRYVALLTGHFHKDGTRFSVWYENEAKAQELVYETYDWAEPGNLYFRDGLNNPTADPVAHRMGGDHQGYLHVKKGESLIFQCAFTNNTDHPVKLGETSGDEMCNTFGMYYPSNGDVWGCTCIGESCI